MAVKIFFSYVHEDQELLNKLKAYLEPLQQEGLIDMQHDSKISTGEEWAQEIDRHLSTAQIILLLVSQYSLNSDNFYNIVMQRALERHERGEARVIPILLRPVYYQRTPLALLQALPTNAKPVTMWQNQEAAFLNIVQGIQGVAKTSSKSSIYHIFQLNDKLSDQIPLLPLMKRKRGKLYFVKFVKDAQFIIDASREAEQRSKSQRTKSKLQNIIETWEELLVESKLVPVPMPLVISEVDK